MYLADIGQNTVEEISPVTAGANLGWNIWEAVSPTSRRRGGRLNRQRDEAGMTWPIVEFDHRDPLLPARGSHRRHTSTARPRFPRSSI